MSETPEAVRRWIGDHIWGEDDFGGFTEGAIAKGGRTREQQVTEYVKELLDLVIPDWREWTEEGRKSCGREGGSTA